MIKTLRIAGVLTAVAAVILFALPVVFGSGNGKDNQKLLDSDTIIEKFKKSQDSLAQKNNQALPPLVVQAQAFARILVPPVPVQEPGKEKITEVERPAPIVQFKLLSTCVHQTYPELSLALIDQPGDGLSWVRPSDKISHFVVKEVKTGLLIVNDGQKNVEIKMETEPTFESIASSAPTPASSLPLPTSSLPGRRTPARSPGTTSVPPMPASGVRTTPGFNGPMTMPRMPSTRSSASVIPEDEAASMKLMSELEAALAGAGANGESTEEAMRKADEIYEKYFNELDNMQISGEEAQKINDMGQKLDNEQQEPNKTRPSTIKTRPQTSPGN